MTEANLKIMHGKAFLEAESKSIIFKIDSTFPKTMFQYLLENNIRIINTESR